MKKRRWILRSIAGTGLALLLFLLWQLDLPHWQRLDIDRLANVRQTTLVYDRDGQAVGRLSGGENRVSVSLAEIPEHVQNAFIAAEDLRFYRHHGVDVRRIFGALWQDIKSLSFRQGASTITQQLIKLTHLTSEKTFSRKVQEAFLALRLEKALSKREILESYLNIVYFGKGAYGIEAAANTYFGKHAADLTLAEGALLAGVVKSPSGYAPHLHPDKAVARRNAILNTMAKNGFISEAQARTAARESLELASGDVYAGTEQAGWYLDAVLQEAREALALDAEGVLSGGYRIYTAFSADLQAAAEEIYADAKYFPEDAVDGTPVQSAFAALDPTNGEVVALIGGRSYEVQRGLNRATQIARQPGSAIKPISVYAAAIDHYGYLPSSFVDDTQRTFAGNYTPRNAGNTYNGLVTLREALSRSLNVATVDLAGSIGLDSVCAYAERFGLQLDENDKNLSLALGSMTYGVSPARLCAAYGALANGGRTVTGHLIRRIESCDGQVLYRYQAPQGRAVREESAFLITDMLKTAAASGSARALNGLDFPIAAKTGTVSMENGGNRDAWVVAYTPDLAACVWMGFDQPDAGHALASANGGGSYPTRLAAAYFRLVADKLSGQDFALPAGLRTAIIDRLSLEQEKRAVLASANTPKDYAVRELFYKNALPESISTLWDSPRSVYDLRLESAEGQTPMLAFTALDANADYVLLRKSAARVEIAATLHGSPGELLRFADVDAAPNEAHEYTIIPRHRLLYEEGVLLTGEESPAVRYSPGGILNRLAGMWEDQFAEPPAEAAPEEHQSIFG